MQAIACNPATVSPHSCQCVATPNAACPTTELPLISPITKLLPTSWLHGPGGIARQARCGLQVTGCQPLVYVKKNKGLPDVVTSLKLVFKFSHVEKAGPKKTYTTTPHDTLILDVNTGILSQAERRRVLGILKPL